MSLDIYVGPFSRYYAGNWELITETIARKSGQQVEVVKADTDEDSYSDTEILETVLNWRDELNELLQQDKQPRLDWNETLDGPYFTDKPGWDCYKSLLIWAAYTENSDLSLPVKYVENVEEDPAFQASDRKGSQSIYGHLLGSVECWFPVDFSFIFGFEDAWGSGTSFGSSQQLFAQLQELNAKTWQANAATIQTWSKQAPEFESPVETGARFAFALLYALVQKSIEHKLPMKLDY